MYIGPLRKPFHKTECQCEHCCQWMVDEIDYLQTALDDANETLQLHQSRGDYEAGQVLGQKAAKAEIQRLKAVIEQSQRSGNLRCNLRSRTSGRR